MTDNFEPILGAVPPEAFSSRPTIFQRVEEIKQIEERESHGTHDSTLRTRLFEARRQLTQDAADLLATATSATTEEKIQLIHDIVPRVRWGYEDTDLRSRDEAKKRKAEQDKIASEARHEALSNLLESIPDVDFTEEALDSLLDLEESVGHEHLFVIRRRVVAAVKQLPPSNASQILPRLRISTTPAGTKRYESEWATVLSSWDIEDASPYVDQLVERLYKHNDLDSYEVLAATIQNWPPERQVGIIQDVCLKQGLDDFRSNKLTDLMKSWPQEHSERVLRELFSQANQNKRIAKSGYRSLATAMSNWTPEAIDEFLEDENNTRWIHEAIGADSHKTIKSTISSETYEQLLNKFRLTILANRDEEITPAMITWIKDGFGLANSIADTRYVESIIKNNPSIFSPELASIMFRGSSVKTAVDLLVEKSRDEQVEFNSAIADLFMGDDLFAWREPMAMLFDDIQKKWSVEEIDSLAIELLSRETVSMAEYRNGQLSSAKNIENAFKLLEQRETLTNRDLIKGVLKYSIADPSSSEGKLALKLAERIETNEDTEDVIHEAACEAVSLKFTSPSRISIGEAILIAQKYDINNVNHYYDYLPRYAASLFDKWNISGLEDFSNFLLLNSDYVSYLSSNPDQACILTRERWDGLVERIPIRIVEAEVALSAGVDLDGIEKKSGYKELFESLVEIEPTWRDEQSITNPFRKGAEIFGYRRMFEYADRQGLTRHDALHAFEDVVAMYEASGLSPDAFYGQIMIQVRSDRFVYETGTAHHEFNSIAQTLNTDFERAREIAANYPQDKELQELAELLSNPKQVFASWNRLKFASSRMELLERTELLEQLQELKDASEKQYTYFRTLLMHPSSKVDAQAVLEFWQDPETFLAKLASHTPDQIQNRKKPSNYIHIPNLDLTAPQMRDSLIEGDLDRIQAFSPMEIRYRIPVVDGKAYTDLRELLDIALKPIERPNASPINPPKKFVGIMNKILREAGTTLEDVLAGNTSLTDETSKNLVDHILTLDKFKQVTWQEITAQIHRKSDPVGVLAGNDTANCMPFGDGKTTVYTYNLNTAQFTMQVDRGDGFRRTVAQSVMTKDKDVQASVPMLYQRLTQEDSHLMDVMPQAVLVDAPAYAAADNIEVAPNWHGEYEQVIEAIYRDFYREYMARFGQAQGFNTDKMVIGQGYSDAMTHLPSEQNTFVPLAPVSYSDKMGDEVFVLDLETGTLPAFDRNVVTPERQEMELLGERPRGNGVSFLTYEDALGVGYMEGKAYADNPVMMQYLHNMENALMGMHINNASKRRPHMSLKYTDADGQMRGYMLAYEGRFEEDRYDDWWKDEGERVVYITDLASDREHQMAGGRLISSFIDLYQKNYLDRDDLVPLYMEARETTSFRIIQRQLDRIGDRLGIEFELEELGKYQEGEDTMHPVVIKPVRR